MSALPSLPASALDQLFHQAHTVHAFVPYEMSDDDLARIYDAMKWAPTAFNAQPARFVFLKSDEAKQRLVPALMEGNIPQVKASSVTVIVAYDSQFYEHLPTQFPVYDAKPLFEGNAAMAEATAFRNSSMQGGYFILAARALGWDTGAMSGFNPQAVNEAFFPEGRYKANFLITLGKADPQGIYPRNPRLAMDEACQIL